MQRFLMVGWVAAMLSVLPLPAAEPQLSRVAQDLPFGERPIDYWGTDSQDPLAQLQRRMDDEQLEIPFVDRLGYLPALLKALDIPVESQLLRFNTGSPHRLHIQPERPRAVYFNDDVSVAWYPGAAQVEFAAQDSRKGTLFYTLTNREDAPPRFHRSITQGCLGCHHGPAQSQFTGSLAPGHIIRSELYGDEAQPYKLGTVHSHVLPLEKRWRGWYVTNITAAQRHRGNLSRPDDHREFDADPTYHRLIFSLSEEFDTDRYPTETSDVAAHLVFNHQMLGLNLLNRLSYEHQHDAHSTLERLLIPYLLLADEAPLDNPVAGKSLYAAWYGQRGPQDDQGRSLYELDLQTRLFRHRISPLIHSRMVQNFPPELKQWLFTRLNAVLTGKEELHESYTLPKGDRTETLAVLRATVPDWPRE